MICINMQIATLFLCTQYPALFHRTLCTVDARAVENKITPHLSKNKDKFSTIG